MNGINIFQSAWDRSRQSVSLVIVGTCTIFFLAVAGLDLLHVVDRRSAICFFGLSYEGVFHRYWVHQFLTAPLLHASVTHLLFNMLSLWMLGPDIEKILGRRSYILFTILCAESSMIGSLIFSAGSGSITVGYSGVIFGILVAQAMYYPDNVVAIFAFFPLRMKYAALLLAGVELYLSLSPEGGGVAHSAHVVGALTAFLYLRWQRRRDIYIATKSVRRQEIPSAKIQNWKRYKIPDKL